MRVRRGNRRSAEVALPLVIAGLTGVASFQAGGFFAGTTGLLAAALALVLVLHVTLVRQPFAGLGKRGLLALVALSLYAAWTLLSASWSGAPARALLEFDRALLYVLALALGALTVRSRSVVRGTVRALGATIAVVSSCALITRALPDLWPLREGIAANRLSFPLTYWNALGLLAALGVVLCLHLTFDEREHPAARVAGAAAVPLLACTLLLTFSRGGILALALGVVVYLSVGRPHALITGALAVLPPSAVALVATYGADRLASKHPADAAAVAQGHRVAAVIAVATISAGCLRALGIRVDARLARWVGRERLGARRRGLAAAAAVLVLVATGLAAGAPHVAGQWWERFVKSRSFSTSDTRSRLTNPGNHGRLGHWKVALAMFRSAPFHGQGAGTFELGWARRRHGSFTVIHAHSLYLESLAELGLVGFGLLMAALGTVIFGFAARARGPDRSLYAALLAAGVAWMVHAGIDWDWQMPAITLWLLLLGGMALARDERETSSAPAPSRTMRVVGGIGLLILALTPASVALSQTRLNSAARAFARGDCPLTIARALSAADVLPLRPEPYELLGYCDLRIGSDGLAVAMMRRAVDRDPNDWEYAYSLAIAEALAGRDPRAEAARARHLNPRDELAMDLVRRLRGNRPRGWRSAAAEARLPFH